MTLGLTVEPGFLRAVVAGPFSLKEAKRTFAELIVVMEQHKSDRVLFDGREVTGKPTDLQRFTYGAFVAAEVALYSARNAIKNPRFAYVLSQPVLDEGRLGETVAENRGMAVKAFDSVEEALKWLGV